MCVREIVRKRKGECKKQRILERERVRRNSERQIKVD